MASSASYEVSKHDKYAELTEIDSDGMIIFKENPTRDQSFTLFMLLYESLGPIHEKITVDARKSDGKQLLAQIEHYFIKKDTSVTNKESLSNEFNTITRNQNEDFSTFTTRYLKKLQELEINEVRVPQDWQTKTYKFLIALNEKVLKTNICLKLQSKPEWYVNMTYDRLSDKAEKYVKHYHTLSLEKTSLKQLEKPPKSDPKPEPSDGASSKSDEKDKLLQKYIAMLKNVNDMEPYLAKIKDKNEEKFNSKTIY